MPVPACDHVGKFKDASIRLVVPSGNQAPVVGVRVAHAEGLSGAGSNELGKAQAMAASYLAATRGHAVFAIDCATLGWRRPESAAPGGVFGVAVQLHMQPDNHDWFREIGRDRIPLTDFDAVVMRREIVTVSSPCFTGLRPWPLPGPPLVVI